MNPSPARLYTWNVTIRRVSGVCAGRTAEPLEPPGARVKYREELHKGGKVEVLLVEREHLDDAHGEFGDAEDLLDREAAAVVAVEALESPVELLQLCQGKVGALLEVGNVLRGHGGAARSHCRRGRKEEMVNLSMLLCPPVCKARADYSNRCAVKRGPRKLG